MNTAEKFDFSLDNDVESNALRQILDSAAYQGWKVELSYHETFGKNWFGNRGETCHFITECKVLDRNFANIHYRQEPLPNNNETTSVVVQNNR